MSVALELEDVRVRLADQEVLKGVDVTLDAGAYGVILGPSGAGKSTLLRAVAGLVPAGGRIRIGDRVVCSGRQVVAVEARSVGFLFQGLALWPHMSVRAHLEYALEGRSVPKDAWGERIAETLDALGIGGFEGRRPAEMSGGERQRLALARALVTRPGILLLDEPTSSVDPTTAADVHELLVKVNRTFRTTVLHVTHDQQEALALGDRVFVLREGRVVQVGTPEEVYCRPRSRATAAFVGRGGVVPGVLREDGRADTPLGIADVTRDEGEENPAGASVWLNVRPEDLIVVSEGDGVPLKVERCSYHGGGWLASVLVGGHPLVVAVEGAVEAGELIRVRPRRALWLVEERTS